MIPIKRTTITFLPDPARVITKPFIPGGAERVQKIVDRILIMSEKAVEEELAKVFRDFEHRHKRFREIIETNYRHAMSYLGKEVHVSDSRRQLIGSYFTMEYSIESAAFFNPSIVPHDDQSTVGEGETRVVFSFRATGEGHISSIAFRTGVIDRENNITINPVSRFVGTAKVVPNAKYNKVIFQRKLREIGADAYITSKVLRKLALHFTFQELRQTIDQVCDPQLASTKTRDTFALILDLAKSNYEMTFDPETHICERVIFPVSDSQHRGIEDARFVQFTQDDGSITYYATYTAVSRDAFMPQLLETPNFIDYRLNTLNGPVVHNKGMALFPRKIGGLYMMIARQDNENLFIMDSDNIMFWEEAHPLQAPVEAWEYVQIGNCGSPIETSEGWILLTHGVGPMRQYCLGAILLDLEDPFRVIGRLKEPLMIPNDREREGYVPNVLYTCGAIKHNDSLIIPYAMSDSCSSVCTVEIDDLLRELVKG